MTKHFCSPNPTTALPLRDRASRVPTVRRRLSGLCCIAGLVFCGSLITPAEARTWVIPHILERSGRVTDTQFTFDTTVFATMNNSLQPGRTGAAQVDFYLFDQTTGQPMVGNSGPVCAPCTFQLLADQRKLSISVDSLISNEGGGFDTEVKLGFGVVVVSGPDAEAVNIQAMANNAHTGPFDVSLFDLGAQSLPPPTNTAAKTYVIPHVLETSGRISTDPNSFDTTIFAAYTGGLAGLTNAQGASIELFLYDQQTGMPMVSATGTEVCNPCSFSLGTGDAGSASPRKRTLDIHGLIQDAGGFASPVQSGFGVVTVGGADPANVGLHGFVVNAHTGPFDLSVFGFEPQPISSSASARTFVMPHVLEKSGRTATPYTFDTTLFATYVSGLGGLPPGSSATLDLYLFDTLGAPMSGSGSVICNPCNFKLGDHGAGTPPVRKEVINFDDLVVNNGGGFDTAVKLGFAVAVVSGDDPAGVNLQGFVVNSHTSAFDLSVFGFTPQEITSEASARTFVVPHVLEREGRIANTQFTFDTTIFATYAAGLAGIGDGGGAELKLFLFNNDGSAPMVGQSGPVCFPCLFPLSSAAPNVSIDVESLILNAGGFDQQVKLGSGLIVLSGDSSHVALGGFLNNAKTGPFDLSVFGFEPQPLLSAARVAPFPVHITRSGPAVSLSLPTVIGYNYSIETNSSISLGGWKTWRTFEGNGVEQTLIDFETGPDLKLYRGSAQ